jgi:hypothetical protein
MSLSESCLVVDFVPVGKSNPQQEVQEWEPRRL